MMPTDSIDAAEQCMTHIEAIAELIPQLDMSELARREIKMKLADVEYMARTAMMLAYSKYHRGAEHESV